MNDKQVRNNKLVFRSKCIKIFIASAGLLLFACNSSQKADEQEKVELEQEDTLLVVENQNSIKFYEKVITDIKGLEHIAIGASISDLKKIYANYVFKREFSRGGYQYTFSNKEKTFYLFLEVCNDIVQGISFSDTNFKLYNGLKVGDPISKIKEKYPNIPIDFDPLRSGDFFIIDDENSRIYIDVVSNDGELLGMYKKDEDGNIEDETFKYRTDGKISYIEITWKHKNE